MRFITPMSQRPLNQRYIIGLMTFGHLLTISSAYALTIKVDPWGYPTQGPKTAVLEDVPADIASGRQHLTLVLVNPGKKDLLKHETVMLRLKPTRFFQQPGPNASKKAWGIVDFSSLTVPGTYKLMVEGGSLQPLQSLGEKLRESLKSDPQYGPPPPKAEKPLVVVSAPIVINNFLYWDALKPLVRAFYLSRASQGIEDSVSQMNRPLPVPREFRAESGEVIDVSGGWLDGDRHTGMGNKTAASILGPDQSIAEHALSLQQLLAAREVAHKPFQYFTLDYPSDDANASGLPDFDHEMRVGLDWLQDMQNQTPNGSVGGFYSGISDATVLRITPEATAMASAALARAARIYHKSDLGYSVQCLRAAERGWSWLQKNQAIAPVNQPLGLGKQTSILWAAAELYMATGKPDYHALLKAQLPRLAPVVWAANLPANTALIETLANYATLQNSSLLKPDPELVALIHQRLSHGADAITTMMGKNPYNLAITQFGANSNGLLLAQTNWLLASASLYPQDSPQAKRYRDAAGQSLHWIMGLNPIGRTFISPLLDEKTKDNSGCG